MFNKIINKSFSSQQSSNLQAILNRLPWDFSALPSRCDNIGNLQSPVPINKVISNNIAVSLFKEFIESIATQDTESLKQILEPSFYNKLENDMDTLSKEL